MFSDIELKKSIAESGNNYRLKIYVEPSRIYVVHFNVFFSETTAPMVLKLHMQHDQISGNDRIRIVENPRWPPVLKIVKPIK